VIRIVVSLLLCLGSFSDGDSSEVTGPEQPRFVKSEADCLHLKSEEPTKSVVAIVEAQYQWLEDNYPGCKFKAHAKPKREYAKKLGCETERGSILRIETPDGDEVTVCFCLPANRHSVPAPSADAG
jgi:hypothetical protein